MAIEFDCEGCGDHIYGVSISHVPKDQLCSTCLFLDIYLRDNLKEFWAVYKRLHRSDRDGGSGVTSDLHA
jgi:hypothetical protein